MSDLAELIKRVEGLQGPDREVDIAICLHLNYVGSHQTGTIDNLRRAGPEDDYLDYECHDDGGSIPECTDCAPDLTASIDAVVALTEKLRPVHWWGIVNEGLRNLGKTDLPTSHLARFILLALLRSMEADRG